MLHQRQKKEARWLVTIEVRKKQFKAKTVLASSLKKIIQLLLYTFLLYEIHKKNKFSRAPIANQIQRMRRV